MNYYPVYLDLRARLCIVIGGGRVAERKVRGLLACGALVRVVSPELGVGLRELLDQEKHLSWIKRQYREGDLDGAFLVIAATDDSEVQQLIYAEAEDRRIPVNVADVPALCSFILPATVRRGGLALAISTGGKCPALAKQLRLDLEKRFGPEYKILVDILGALRPEVLACGQGEEDREAVFAGLLQPQMLDWIRARAWDKVEDHLHAVLGDRVEADWQTCCLTDSGGTPKK